MTNSINKCVAGVAVLMSNPPQYKCANCGQTWFSGSETPTCHSLKGGAVPSNKATEECNHEKLRYNTKFCPFCGIEFDPTPPTKAPSWEEIDDKIFRIVARIIGTAIQSGTIDGKYADDFDRYRGEIKSLILNNKCECRLNCLDSNLKLICDCHCHSDKPVEKGLIGELADVVIYKPGEPLLPPTKAPSWQTQILKESSKNSKVSKRSFRESGNSWKYL